MINTGRAKLTNPFAATVVRRRWGGSVASACAPAKPYRHVGPCADLQPRSPAPARSKLYNPHHPERTVLYRAVAGHLQTWLALSGAGQFDGQGDHQTPPAVGGSGGRHDFPDSGRSGSDTPVTINRYPERYPTRTWLAVPRIGRQKTKKPRG